jgi:hypothetical protein
MLCFCCLRTSLNAPLYTGWSYIFFPTFHIYRMSYHDLIPKLRSSLRFIWEKGSAMEKRWAAQISLPDVKHALPLPLEKAQVMDRRDTGRSYKGTAPTHATQGDVYDRRESDRAPTSRTPRKAPALFSEEGAVAEPRGWRLALDGENNSDNENWKAFDIDTQEDLPVSYTPFESSGLLTQIRQTPYRKK